MQRRIRVMVLILFKYLRCQERVKLNVFARWTTHCTIYNDIDIFTFFNHSSLTCDELIGSFQKKKTECFCGMVPDSQTGLEFYHKVSLVPSYSSVISAYNFFLQFYMIKMFYFILDKKNPGLRIAPPEAPVTGYMFGKGVYFADMFSKSANYCCSTKSATDGVLLLCEVI